MEDGPVGHKHFKWAEQKTEAAVAWLRTVASQASIIIAISHEPSFTSSLCCGKVPDWNALVDGLATPSSAHASSRITFISGYDQSLNG